ncbi:hypothetical protein C7N43_28865 [Sphingobacteriales bacterium UPWRP_1]|nr:hypothetical protein BVG80_04220 [Sphingobacteriales bacterium TSM_CSM]PSJ73479.1 hypothetical protein C7N43_28865 [Sphingobacteriales bacterium UPWRP_1]
MKTSFFSVATIALAFFFIGTLGSCKKDDKSKTELLTHHSWKVKAATINPAIDIFGTGELISDLYANNFFYPACTKDDFMTFKDNGQVISDEGATKCSAGDPQTTTQNWTFNSTETVITISELDGSDPQSFNISSLTEDEVVISNSESIDNVVYTFTTTFEPK